MTTGSKVLNGLYMQSTPRRGLPNINLQTGIYYSKTWVGGDSSPAQRAARIVVPKPSGPPLQNWSTLPRSTPKQRALIKSVRSRTLANIAAAKAAKAARQPKKTKKRVKRSLGPLSYTMTKRTESYGSYACWAKGYEKAANPDWYQLGGPIETGHIGLDPKDHYKMIEKLRKKAYGSGFHPGIFVAEMPKTLQMIFNAATRLRHGVVAASKGDWRTIVRNFGVPPGHNGLANLKHSTISLHAGKKSLASLWLEIQYGWKPLLSDIESGAAAIADALHGNQKNRTRLCARSSFVKTSIKLPTGNSLGHVKRITTHKVQYVITQLSSSPPTALPSIPSVAAVAWEIVPYSFVVDWVAPIGDYLQALRTSKDLTGTVVRSILSETVWEDFRNGPSLGKVILVTPIPTDFRLTSFERTVTPEISVPSPLGDLSPSSVISGWTRAANAVALMANLKLPAGDFFGTKKLTGR